MTKDLIIVESPAKARSLERYLGGSFSAIASYGHVRDLEHSGGRGVDVGDDFSLSWESDERSQKQLKTIEKAVRHADSLYLATDPDREGEAISWHILEILNDRGAITGQAVHRVVFHEVTKEAVQHAIAHPRPISKALVDAYLARRTLDYLLGYSLSPELWKKIKRGLSAGRVQSPALRLLCEREREILDFTPREYWTIESDLEVQGTGFSAKLYRFEGARIVQFSITDAEEAQRVRAILESAANGQLRVSKIEEKPRKRNPSPPFTTSTLQQEAVRKLGFTAKKTMRVAQQLYEGIDIDGARIGLITYMRTDSVMIGSQAVNEIRTVIAERYGVDSVPSKPNQYRTKTRNAQEAHEAIRPTSAARLPANVGKALDKDQQRLYSLVWQRAVASQMIPATLKQVTVDLSVGSSEDHIFRATGSTVMIAGFMQVYQEGRDDSSPESERVLPDINRGDLLKLRALRAEQHFTEPKGRFTEASLVRELEAKGIGRPSTYASILSTLVDRSYAVMDRRRFLPTDLGYAVNGFLTWNFSPFVDYEFTARMEDALDDIANDKTGRGPILTSFWEQLSQHLESEHQRPVFDLGKEPESERQVSWRVGPYGTYVQLGVEEDGEELVRKTVPPDWAGPALSLDMAVWLLSLPRTVGSDEDGESILVDSGRYGLYLRCGTKSASLPRDIDAMVLSQDQVRQVMEDASRLPRELGEDASGQMIMAGIGRFGPYVRAGSTFASLRGEDDPYTVTLDRAEQL
ncbi:MAG: type I DNA topoisomerase, partial [Pseudomonadota bacterium]|nr:type I DNA topoisomerase [Pseudomonadota bacterium]